MATIIIRNSTGSGVIPSSLQQGELAINTKDGKLFYGSGSGNIVKEFTGSGGATFPYIGNAVITGSLTVSGSTATQLLVGTSLLFVSSSGNVGIGTTSSAYNLEVVGSNTNTARFYGGSGTAVVGIGVNGTLQSSGGQFRLYGNSSVPLSLGSYGVWGDIWIINGNIGIGQGTTTPTLTSRFTVKGSGATSATTALRVENTNASASLVVRDDGNVGIGTIVPTASLHISASTADAAYSFWVQNSLGQTLISTQNNRIVSINNTNNTNGATYIGTTSGGVYFNQGYNNSFIGNAITFYSGNNHSTIQGWSSPTSGIAVGYAQTNTNPNTGSVFTVKGAAETSGSGVLFVTGSSATRLLTVSSETISNILTVSGSGLVNIGLSGSAYGSTGTSNGKLTINNTSGNNGLAIRNGETGYQLGIRTTVNDAIGAEFVWYDGGTVTFLQHGGSAGTRLGASGYAQFRANIYNPDGNATIHTGASNTERLRVTNAGLVGIGTSTPSASLHVAGTTRLSGSFNTATSGSILTVIGSGSTQPIFTVQGSQGELFSIVDSLSGSLFSVNDISGLPILEVFSDSTTLIGDYLDPMLITTKKVTMTNSGSFVVYSLPTASYDTAFFDYSIKSGSNARAGQIMAIQSGSSVNFTETTTTDFGSTTAVSFTVLVSGSNMVLTGSASTGSWTIKSIIRGL
jgi:hypothetical protein